MIRKRKLTLKREAERRGEEVKSKDEAEARSYVLKKKIKAESSYHARCYVSHIFTETLNVPSSLRNGLRTETRIESERAVRHESGK